MVYLLESRQSNNLSSILFTFINSNIVLIVLYDVCISCAVWQPLQRRIITLSASADEIFRRHHLFKLVIYDSAATFFRFSSYILRPVTNPCTILMQVDIWYYSIFIFYNIRISSSELSFLFIQVSKLQTWLLFLYLIGT